MGYMMLASPWKKSHTQSYKVLNETNDVSFLFYSQNDIGCKDTNSLRINYNMETIWSIKNKKINKLEYDIWIILKPFN